MQVQCCLGTQGNEARDTHTFSVRWQSIVLLLYLTIGLDMFLFTGAIFRSSRSV